MKELHQLVQQQSDFIAIAAHEFRTPLTIAMLQLESTLASNVLRKPLREDLKVLESALEKMKQLTQELFDVQQYDLNKVELRPRKMGFSYFISDIFLELREFMAQKGITLTLEHNRSKAPLFISIDRAKMRQVLHNLLNNAYKFTPENGSVTIRTTSSKKTFTISVIDNGPGIGHEVKSRLFEKFQNGNGGTGIGLGLYLCKKIVELHRGTISVSDVPGGGSCFTMNFPIH